MCFTPQCPRMGCWEMEGYFSQPFLKRQSHQFVHFFYYFQRECPLSRNRISSAFQNPKVYFAWLFTIIVLVLSTLASLVQSILLLVDCEINLSIKLLHNIVTTLGNPFKRYPLMLHSTQALSRLFLVIFYFLLLHY